MYVILNSDLLYTTYLIKDRLPASLEDLCKVCVEHSITICMPETTLLEFSHKQQGHAERERHILSKAYERLAEYGIKYEYHNPSDLILVSDLVQLMCDAGATVEVVIPTEDELRKAHRRACLHEPPLSSDSKSNEMRDIIIWLIALRIAREQGAALLLSADRVHKAESGEAEAASAGLQRADSIEQGLELLEYESPSTELARKLLEPAWDSLVEAGLPLQLPVVVKSVRDSKFKQGVGDLKTAHFRLKGITGDGKTFETDVDLKTSDNRRIISLSRVELDNQPLSDAVVEIEEARKLEDYEDRLAALREILGD
jgi:hypothetical protein